MMTTTLLEDKAGAEVVTVESRKFDGRLHRAWRGKLIGRDERLVVIEGVFEEEIAHNLLGRIEAGTRSVEFYWFGRWYSVFRFENPSGALRNFYCNVNTPFTLEAGTLTFTDLDIDILVMPDFSYTVLDLDEFEEHARLYQYPSEVVAGARRALAELLRMIDERRFPFGPNENET